MSCPNCGADAPETYYDDHNDRDAVAVTDPDDAASCSECFENPECPGECNAPHDEPEPDGEGQWQCPTTQQWYRATGPETDLEWWTCDLSRESRLVGDEWYHAEDTFECPGCERNYHADDGIYNESHGQSYCESCDPGEDHDTGDHADPYRYARCVSCGNRIGSGHTLYFDPDTERTYCSEDGAHVHGVLEVA